MFGKSTNKFDPAKDVPDLEGKIFVVTGGTAGIGLGIAAHLLRHNPAKVFIVGSSEDTLCHAYAELKSFGDVTTKLEPIHCDLNDLSQTDFVTKKLAAELTRLDGLVLNAGLGVGPFELSQNGIDTHMQVNVIAQHHMMMLLLPRLLDTADSRIVYQSSDFHRLNTSGVEFANLEEINHDVGPSQLYSRTKLAQILIQQALLRRKNNGDLGLTPGKAPWILATHPGGVVTDQQDQAVQAYGTMGKLGVKAARPFMKDPVEEGCRPALYAVTSEDISSGEFDGAYIVPDKKVTDTSSQAQDQDLEERCLRLVESTLRDNLGNLIEYEMASQKPEA